MIQVNHLIPIDFLFHLGDKQQAEKTVTIPPSPFDPLAEQTALVDGVQKFTVYQITVLCFTSPGDGPHSAAVTAKTAEDGKATAISHIKTGGRKKLI